MSSDMVILPSGWSLIKDVPDQDKCQVEVRFITPGGKIKSLVYQFETTEDGAGSVFDSGGNDIGTWDDLINTMRFGDCMPSAWAYFKSAWPMPIQVEWEQKGISHHYHLVREGCATVIFHVLELETDNFLCTLKMGSHLALSGYAKTLEEAKTIILAWYNKNMVNLPEAK